MSDKMLKRSKDIAAMLPYWEMVADIIGGIGAMRAAGDKYLHRFIDEPDKKFAFRLKNTKMTNIYRDIVESLASKPFEQEVTLPDDEGQPVPDDIKGFIENVDGAGNNLTVFAALTFYNAINTGIDWIFVDYPEDDGTVLTIAEAKLKGRRPYWSRVLATNILDVKSTMKGSNEVLTFIRFLEPGSPDQIREFEVTESGSVVWRVYTKGDKQIDDSYFVVTQTGTLGIDVIPLVPVVTGRREGRSWRLYPPMQDAAELQVELYQQESNLKYASILTSFPMLTGNGVTPKKTADGVPLEIGIGPDKVLYAEPRNDGSIPTWQWLEINAQSLIFLAARIEADQQQLRELGRQPLTSSSSNLTVITTAVAASKAKAAVSHWVHALKDALENALIVTGMWLGIEYDAEVSVFTEFDEFIDGKDLDTVLAIYEKQAISLETFWHELKRRGVLSASFDDTKERERLLNDIPGDTQPVDINA